MNVTTTGIASHRGSLLLQLWKMQSFCPEMAGIRSLWWATSCLCGSSIPGLASSPLRFGPATNLLLLSLRSRNSCPPLSACPTFLLVTLFLTIISGSQVKYKKVSSALHVRVRTAQVEGLRHCTAVNTIALPSCREGEWWMP